MTSRKYLDTHPLYELTKYKGDPEKKKNSLSLTGAIRKHPYDEQKLLLITDPFSSDTEFFEFRIMDIAYVEEQPSIVSETGENLFMARIWVKKGSLGIQYHPFEVSDKLNFLKDSEVLHQAMTDKDD
ncbi:MAG TPA: hypothetical protein ENN41_05445 [Sediminispirochaeta sp.]|nr:hypothetical protein [Sediminispirochaeta sp.]